MFSPPHQTGSGLKAKSRWYQSSKAFDQTPARFSLKKKKGNLVASKCRKTPAKMIEHQNQSSQWSKEESCSLEVDDPTTIALDEHSIEATSHIRRLAVAEEYQTRGPQMPRSIRQQAQLQLEQDKEEEEEEEVDDPPDEAENSFNNQLIQSPSIKNRICLI